jgi:hypothetical protein
LFWRRIFSTPVSTYPSNLYIPILALGPKVIAQWVAA